MVCLPCVAVPILLLFWRFLIQPLIMKFWQYKVKNKGESDEQPPQLVKKCDNGVCTLGWEKTPKVAKVE